MICHNCTDDLSQLYWWSVTTVHPEVNGYLTFFRAGESAGGEEEEWCPHLSYTVSGTNRLFNSHFPSMTINKYGMTLTCFSHECLGSLLPKTEESNMGNSVLSVYRVITQPWVMCLSIELSHNPEWCICLSSYHTTLSDVLAYWITHWAEEVNNALGLKTPVIGSTLDFHAPLFLTIVGC